MLEAFDVLVNCITSIVNMLFRLPLAENVTVGSFWLAAAVLGAVISVIFASVKVFNMISRNNRRGGGNG